jgi:hypothetical protein
MMGTLTNLRRQGRVRGRPGKPLTTQNPRGGTAAGPACMVF